MAYFKATSHSSASRNVDGKDGILGRLTGTVRILSGSYKGQPFWIPSQAGQSSSSSYPGSLISSFLSILFFWLSTRTLFFCIALSLPTPTFLVFFLFCFSLPLTYTPWSSFSHLLLRHTLHPSLSYPLKPIDLTFQSHLHIRFISIIFESQQTRT